MSRNARNVVVYQAPLPSFDGSGRALAVVSEPPAGIAEKRMGRVFTPAALAQALCRWAIRAETDQVLDLGVGEGIFALAAVDRLRELGSDDVMAAAGIHGAEVDAEVFGRAQAAAVAKLGRRLPHVVCADFYDVTLPAVDAVVGNPPYVRRQLQHSVAKSQVASGANGAHGLTDTYCYFLYRACQALRPGGRLAVVVSASWLDMNYGRELKRLLLERFRLRLLLGFDGRVFSDALVKPVVLLAEKTASAAPVAATVPFARLRSPAPLEAIGAALEGLVAGTETLAAATAVTHVPRARLTVEARWSGFFKAPGVYEALVRLGMLVPLGEVAASRIGLQTFAKPFFILSRADAARWRIEPEYLRPIAVSPRDVKTPAIADPAEVKHVVFACDRPMEALQGTAALRYIMAAMATTVPVRGKDDVVRGYHQAPRLVRARRRPWYNLRTALEKRGTYDILLPRRVFETYLVVENCAGVAGNEDFIELQPHGGAAVVAPLLAFLNSSFGEFLVRSHGFQYGGGVFNLNPGVIPHIPALDPRRLGERARSALAAAWSAFVAGYGEGRKEGARAALDEAVVAALRLPAEVTEQVRDALAELVRLAPAANAAH